MNDFEQRIPDDEAMVEDWPDPTDYDDDETDFDAEPEYPRDYEIRFKAERLTQTEVDWINRYLFDVISKELEISYSKLSGLEIEED